MRAAVVAGDDLDVLVAQPAVAVLVLDARVGEVDAVVEVRELVFPRPGTESRAPPGRAGRRCPLAAVPLLQEPLVLALQLVVEDDAPDPPAVLAQARLGASVGAVDLRVVRQLPRLPEAGVERLAGLPAALQAMGLQQVAAGLRENDGLPCRSRRAGTVSTRPDSLRCWMSGSGRRDCSSPSCARRSSTSMTRNAPIVARARLSTAGQLVHALSVDGQLSLLPSGKVDVRT